MDKELSRIIDLYWADYVEHKEKPFVVNPSIPIIWFGDMEAYKKSKFKVVTVAINPSNIEFTPTSKEYKEGKKSPFLRFKTSEDLINHNNLSDDQKNTLSTSLNDYFKDEPYTKWFNWYERFLRLLNKNVSYFPNDINCALHIDIYTALATSPTWRNLTKAEKESITNMALFKELLSYLNPDLVVFSGNFSVFENTVLSTDDKLYKEYSYTPQNAKYPFKICAYKSPQRTILFGSNVRGNPVQLDESFIKTSLKDLYNK